MSLNWTAVNDLDIEFYEIRYSIGSGTTAWFNTSPLVQVPRRKSNSVVVNALKPPFNLYIKAVYKLGNESANPAIITSSVVLYNHLKIFHQYKKKQHFLVHLQILLEVRITTIIQQ